MKLRAARLWVVVCLLVAPGIAEADDVSLAWDASTTPNVTGYQILYGLASRQYTSTIDVGLALTTRITLPVGEVYYVSVRAYDARGLVSAPANELVISTVHGPILPPDVHSSARFLGADTTTRGNWAGVYGRVGAVVQGDATTVPASLTVATSGALTWTWNPSPTSTRALQRHGAAGRIAATWYSGNEFWIEVALPPGQEYAVSLYAVDWDARGRAQEIQAIDTASGTTLDTRWMSAFNDGQYIVWSVSGSVTFRVINRGPVNAVVSGIFLDPVGASPAENTARFVAVDQSTAGSWRGVYGREGYHIINDVAAFPSHIGVTLDDALAWTWDGAATRSEALQRTSGLGRIAATAYSGDRFSIDVRVTDGREHLVSLYTVDWDFRGRLQRVEVSDPATGTVLDARDLYAFEAGQYVTWAVRGDVRLTIINAGLPNAVVSGIFVDPAP